MKKFLMIATLAISLMACTNTTTNKYQEQAEQLAKQLTECYQKQDTAAVLALNDSIRALEAGIIASGDTASIAVFQKALKDARSQVADMITVVEMNKGVAKDTVVKNTINEVMNGSVSIGAVTKSIDAALEKEAEQQQQ